MIGLMDCNNFFVSCERLFRPDLLKRPVAVLSSNDGCIVARSQEIKKLGIPMGVPYFKVRDVCTEAGAVLFSSNFTLYRDISSRVMQTLADEVGPCEVYSIDEAFFSLPDTVTEAKLAAIRERIYRDVGLPVSIGAASTKTLAKQGSEIAKKGSGVCVLTPALFAEAVAPAPCASVWGLGRQTSEKLRRMGVETVAQFLALDRAVVRAHFGVGGERIYSELSGTPAYAVGHTTEDIRKSLMSSRSFEKTTHDRADLESAVAYHVNELAGKLREKHLLASRMYVSLLTSRHSDYFLRGGSEEIVLEEPTAETSVLIGEALRAVRAAHDPEVPYKKAGVVLSGLMPEAYASASLFERKESRAVDAVADLINARFGHNAIHSAAVRSAGPKTSAKLRSPQYTTRWGDIPTVRA
jgi:DNA polymerase V